MLGVDEDVRLQGIARRLMKTAADWSRSRGYREAMAEAGLARQALLPRSEFQ